MPGRYKERQVWEGDWAFTWEPTAEVLAAGTDARRDAHLEAYNAALRDAWRDAHETAGALEQFITPFPGGDPAIGWTVVTFPEDGKPLLAEVRCRPKGVIRGGGMRIIWAVIGIGGYPRRPPGGRPPAEMVDFCPVRGEQIEMDWRGFWECWPPGYEIPEPYCR